MADITFTKIDGPSAPPPLTFTKEPAGPAPSAGERIGMGIADPVYGMAQLGARTPLSLEFPEATLPETYKQSVDKQTQDREKDYQARRAAAGQTGVDWLRLGGNLVSDTALSAPLALAAPEVSGMALLPRLGVNATLGGVSGAESGLFSPVTGKNFGSEKLGQVVSGEIGGEVGGAAFGELANAFARNSPKAVENFIRDQYARFVKPSVAGKNNASQTQNVWDKTRSAIGQIVRNKENLELTHPESSEPVRGQLPQSLEQFSEALDQTKRKIFAEYDALAKKADTAETGNVTSVPKFRDQYAAAMSKQSETEKAVSVAENKVTMAAAKQQRAGNNVYSSSAANEERKLADDQLKVARAALDNSQKMTANARKNLRGTWVDLQPVVSELKKIGSSKAMQDNPKAAGALGEVRKWIQKLSRRGAYSPSEAQDVIQQLNAGLKVFYKNPDYNAATTTVIDSLVANQLRKGTDEAIEAATGAEYQPLKRAYGALASIEKEVAHRAIVSGRQNPGGGILGNIGDVVSADQVLHGLAAFDPASIVTGAALRSYIPFLRYLRSPNRAVRRLFEAAEGAGQPPTTMQQVAPHLNYAVPGTGAASGQAVVNTLGLR